MSEETPSAPAKKLVLVDAYSLLFRAFFAGRYLSTRDNRPTGALYGFSNMLFTLLNNEKPDAIIVCWDAPEQTLRRQQFESYKAHRPEVDPQLRAQMPVARQVVEAFGIPSAEMGGYEADDLIGTLAKRGAREGYAVTILTGDSDQLQLVGDSITVQMTQKGVSEVKVYDADAVQERYGIGPERIADWKALVGDTSDNIPGVPGIGDKTATLLLQQWGTLENLLEHIPEVTPLKARAALEANIEQARLSKSLATIVCDAPIEQPILPYAPTAEDWDRLRALFADLEFKSLMARIPRPKASDGTAPVVLREGLAPEPVFTPNVVHVQTRTQLTEVIEAVKRTGTAALLPDADNTQPMRANLRGLAIAPSGEIGYYIPLSQTASESDSLGGLFDLAPNPPPPLPTRQGDKAGAQPTAPPAKEKSSPDAGGDSGVGLDDLRPLLTDPAIAWVGHNAKFARIVLDRHGIPLAPFAFDTLVGAYLLNSGRASYPLMDLAESYLAVRLEANDAFAPQETLAQEAALVAALVAPLKAALADYEMTEILEKVEMPLIPVLASMEEIGLKVDDGYLATLSARMNAQIESLAQEIYALAGEEFNIGSTKQLQTILFEKLQLPTGKKIKTGFSTGADLLEQLAPQYAICRKILDYREVAKLKSTYTDILPKLIHPETGRIHTSLNQTVASTGRLSSSDPNLQNIPVRSEIGREIRRAFISPSGKRLLSCDYSQIELRLLAHIARDPTLVAAFQNDEDIHAATAATVFGVPLEEVTPAQRRQAKTINFAVIYGQSGFSLANTLGVDTATATQWIKDYFERLPGVRQYIEETTALAHRQKYVTTLMGRRRYLPELDSGNHAMRQFAERAAVNMPIQGTAADIMKLAMIDIYAWLQTPEAAGCALLLQVHDELLFEVEEARIPAVMPEIVRRMEAAYPPLEVRLRVDAKCGPNWTDMRPVSAS